MQFLLLLLVMWALSFAIFATIVAGVMCYTVFETLLIIMNNACNYIKSVFNRQKRQA